MPRADSRTKGQHNLQYSMFNHKQCPIWFLAFTFLCFPLWAADVVRPLHVVHVSLAESQVDEGSTQNEASWCMVHLHGLKVMNVKSGDAIDVLKALEEERWRREYGNRCLTFDGKFFSHSTPKTRSVLTVCRVGDGSKLAQLDAMELFKQPTWPSDYTLAGEGTHCFVLMRQQRRNRIVRVDFFPTPRITSSQELGPLGHHMFVMPHPSSLVVAVPAEDTDKSSKGRWLHVFDHQLQLKYKEKVASPMNVLAAVDLPNPLIVLKSMGREDSYRSQPPSHWMMGQLIRGSANSNKLFETSRRTNLARQQWIVQAAFSSDGKWLVTTRVDVRPALQIWSTGTGKLHREVHVDGGQHKLPGHQVIRRLAFSKSDRFLCASDAANAYLLDFPELLADQLSEP